MKKTKNEEDENDTNVYRKVCYRAVCKFAFQAPPCDRIEMSLDCKLELKKGFSLESKDYFNLYIDS